MARVLELNLGVTFSDNNIRTVTKTATKTFPATNILSQTVTVPMNNGTTTITVSFAASSTTLVILTSGELTVAFTSGTPGVAKTFTVKNMLVFEHTNFTTIQLTNPSTTTDVEANVYLV